MLHQLVVSLKPISTTPSANLRLRCAIEFFKEMIKFYIIAKTNAYYLIYICLRLYFGRSNKGLHNLEDVILNSKTLFTQNIPGRSKRSRGHVTVPLISLCASVDASIALDTISPAVVSNPGVGIQTP